MNKHSTHNNARLQQFMAQAADTALDIFRNLGQPPNPQAVAPPNAPAGSTQAGS
jgi:hypothetical protein